MTREEAILYMTLYRQKLVGSVSDLDKDIEAYDMAIKALEQEPKTGHWEYVQYDYNPRLGNWHCSECRCVVIECVDKNEKGGIPLYKYCPNCGARMETR